MVPSSTVPPTRKNLIRIASLNSARHASAGSQDLLDLLNEVDIDIIGLQEIKVSRPLSIPGYAWIPGLDKATMPETHQGIDQSSHKEEI